MNIWFDTRTLAACLRTKRGDRGLREVATEIGVISASTLSRVERGAAPDVEIFLRLCDWLQMPTSAFIRSNPAGTNEKDSADLVEQALREDGTLSPEIIQAFLTLIRAVRSPSAPRSK